MTSRRDILLQGDTNPESDAIVRAGPGVAPRLQPGSLPVVSGYGNAGEAALKALGIGAGLVVGIVLLGAFFCHQLYLYLTGGGSLFEFLPYEAQVIVYAGPLVLLLLPGLFRDYVLPLIKARGDDMAIRLTAAGFEDRRGGHGFIPWAAVQGLRRRRFSIDVKVDWSAVPGGRKGGGKAVRIFTPPLEIADEALLREMEARRTNAAWS